MKELSHDTENKILDAAKNVFVRKGFSGTRMQEIADKAKINKALLHYYFRSKEKLFTAVFRAIFKKFIPFNLEVLSSEDMPVFDKIRAFTENYINVLTKNPFVPIFILHEINRNPQRIVNIIREFGIKPEIISLQIEKEINAGIIRQVKPQQIIVNMISLCVFPIAARPLLQRMLFENNKKEYDSFLEQRREDVAEFIINSIKAK